MSDTRTKDQWRSSATDPPSKAASRIVLVVYPNGEVDTTWAGNVRDFPNDYPRWMELPEPPR